MYMPQVGTEWVCKTQNTNSCEVSVGSIIKNIYGRLFRYIVDMCNNTLIVSSIVVGSILESSLFSFLLCSVFSFVPLCSGPNDEEGDVHRRARHRRL